VDVPRLEDLGDLSGRRVLVRCDFNVPLSEGAITDDLRIRAALPTLRYLLDAGAEVTACSHLGRPRGAPDPAFAMDPVRDRLAELAPGVSLLENLRFSAEEVFYKPLEECERTFFVRKLAPLIDYVVNDAFAAAHRSQPSLVGLARLKPMIMGFLMERELYALGKAYESDEKPRVYVLGGAKVDDSLRVIQ